MKQVKDYTPYQSYMINFNPSEFFARDSLEWVINNIIEEHIELDPFLKKMNNHDTGQKQEHPRMMLKVLFYAYSTRVYSSRLMEKNMRTNLSYIFLSGYQLVDHSTICRFIHKFGDEIKNVFTKVLYVCNQLGLMDTEMVAYDGTKISGNAAAKWKGNADDFNRKKVRLERRIEFLLEKQKRIDKEDDEAQDRLNRMLTNCYNYMEKIDNFFNLVDAGELNPKEKINLTDPDCKTQKNMNIYCEGFTGQIAVNDKIILSQRINNHQSERNDLDELNDLLANQLSAIGLPAEILKKSYQLADKGFLNSEILAKLTNEGYDFYIPEQVVPAVDKAKKITSDHCDIIKDDDSVCLLCPGGRKLSGNVTCREARHSYYKFFASKSGCVGCSYFEKCCGQTKGSKKFSVSVEVIDNHEILQQHSIKMQSKSGKEIYNERIGMVERSFGIIKDSRDFTKIYHRGLASASIIWSMVCTAYNLRVVQKCVAKQS